MSSIPSAKGIDSTLALLRNPYEFIPDTGLPPEKWSSLK